MNIKLSSILNKYIFISKFSLSINIKKPLNALKEYNLVIINGAKNDWSYNKGNWYSMGKN